MLEVSTSVATAFVVASLSFSSSLSSLSFFLSLETSTPSVFSLDLDLKRKIKRFLEYYSFSQGEDTDILDRNRTIITLLSVQTPHKTHCFPIFPRHGIPSSNYQ